MNCRVWYHDADRLQFRGFEAQFRGGDVSSGFFRLSLH
jgi:hypothetical protein